MSLTKYALLWLMPGIIVGVSVVTAYAQETLTLEQALSIAKQNNTQMVKARKNSESAKARLSTAKTYANPEINYKRYGFQDGKNDYELDATQEIDIFGKRTARTAIAETDISFADAALNLIWSDVALEIKEAYFNFLLMHKKQVLAKENCELFRKLLDSVHIKYNSGKVLLSEVMRAKIELSQAENEVFLADKELSVARATFNLLLSKPIDYEFTVGDSLDFIQQSFDYKELVQQAGITNPTLKARIYIAQMNHQGVNLEKSNVFSNPKIGYVQKSEEGWNASGVSIDIGLPIWNRNRGAIKEKEIEAEKAAQDVAYITKQIEVAVYDAVIEAEAASKQVVNYRRSVEQSHEIQNQVDLQFKEGKTDFLAYLDSLRTVKNVKVGYCDAVVNYNKKIALIEKLVGKE